MQWNLRMAAAERGIWKSTELRRLLAEAGLEISAGKMSALWTGTPTTIRLDDLDVICAVLGLRAVQAVDPRTRPRSPPSAPPRRQPTGTGDEPGHGRPAPLVATAARPQPDPTAVVSRRHGKNKPSPASSATSARSLDQPTGRLLLPVPARRSLPAAAVPALRAGMDGTGTADRLRGRVLLPRPVHPLPHRRPATRRRCRDCLAWGVIRKHKWLCWRCHSWRARFPRGTCRICSRGDLPVNPDHACGLCDRQMVITPRRHPRRSQRRRAADSTSPTALAAHPDPLGRVRQLDKPNPQQPSTQLPAEPTVSSAVEFYPVDADPADPVRRAPRPDLAQAAGCSTPTGCPTRPTRAWRPSSRPPSSTTPAATAGPTRRSTAPNGRCGSCSSSKTAPAPCCWPATPSALRTIGLTATPVIDVATAAGVMLDDRGPTIHAWFDTTIADLPVRCRPSCVPGSASCSTAPPPPRGASPAATTSPATTCAARCPP